MKSCSEQNFFRNETNENQRETPVARRGRFSDHVMPTKITDNPTGSGTAATAFAAIVALIHDNSAVIRVEYEDAIDPSGTSCQFPAEPYCA